MAKIDLSDLQGNIVRGYRFPFACYSFLRIDSAEEGREFVGVVTQRVTTGESWGEERPDATLNIAFTHRGLAALQVPDSSLLSFPVDFCQGMKTRHQILGDTGRNAPENWDSIWQKEADLHIWISINARTENARADQFQWLEDTIAATGGVTLLEKPQDAAALKTNGEYLGKEHFGYTDGIGNPHFEGSQVKPWPGRGKIASRGGWEPLARGEFILGHADESGEWPVAPIPALLSRNGTFMVYRKLHQNVGTFRKFLNDMAESYPGGGQPQETTLEERKEFLAAKFAGRWRDGTPVELSPDRMDKELAADRNRNNDFTYHADQEGTRCPLGAHVRRMNPRDDFGFDGKLGNRRRILRRGLTYGAQVPEGETASDDQERGIIFMALNVSIERQFEFVQQQWLEFGNDFALGNDKDILVGNHDGNGKAMIQGAAEGANPPFICSKIPQFVELRGGDYFFLPSLTALRLLASGRVDPR